MIRRLFLHGLFILMVIAGRTGISDGAFMQTVYRIAMLPGVIIGTPIFAVWQPELGWMLMTAMALSIPVYGILYVLVITLYNKATSKVK